MKRKLTAKQKEFVKVYTDPSDKTTHLNATQSVAKVYNVINTNVAKSMGSENLAKPSIIQAIEKRILKKEELQAKQSNLVENIEHAINTSGYTVENTPLINQLGINIERQAKINGDLIDRIESINLNIDRNKDISNYTAEQLQEEVMKRMQSI